MQTLKLANESLTLSILPQCGGKIESLYVVRHQHEWLWKNPHLALRAPSCGESYVEALDFGGWDEICPSVHPCKLTLPDSAYGNVPDHGDLVQVPWTVDACTEKSLKMSAKGRSLPFVFERAIKLEGTNVHLDYRLTNTGKFAFPWLWCAHPLFPLSKDLRIDVPHSACFEVTDALGAALPLVGKPIQLSELIDLQEFPFAAKLFSQAGSVDWLALQHRNGAQLKLSWDTSKLPYLGLWINNGGWAGTGTEMYHNLGIEPSTQPGDDLSQLAHPNLLDPNASTEWQIRLSSN